MTMRHMNSSYMDQDPGQRSGARTRSAVGRSLTRDSHSRIPEYQASQPQSEDLPPLKIETRPMTETPDPHPINASNGKLQ